MRNFLKSILIIFILAGLLSAKVKYNSDPTKVNKSHLDYLYKIIKVNGKEMGIIHIYCDFPSYKFVDAKGEGYACVDDAARAGIFYLEYFKKYNDQESLEKFNMLTRFIMYMQSGNGFFYNFIENDNSINKTYRTSIAEPNWWSWRALWLLMESYKYYKTENPERADIIFNSIKKCVKAIKKIIPEQKQTKIVDGVTIPDWLPSGSGADQSALLIISLSDYYNLTGDKKILEYIRSLAEGIMMMQIVDSNSPFYSAFLSWENTWHAWGNSQSFALLKAYKVTKDEKILQNALKELNNFYPFLLKNKYLSNFKLKKSGNHTEVLEKNKFPQIAYDIEPMVFALLEAYKITGKNIYAERAGEIAGWFRGNNPANVNMYNSESGIVYDGILNERNINKNSGAESTIETLLTLLKISETPAALNKYLNNNEK